MTEIHRTPALVPRQIRGPRRAFVNREDEFARPAEELGVAAPADRNRSRLRELRGH
ncbi:hypothetical protein [Kitasatospora sp. NPDC008115]|uniref:hypothetical protein n=1 Tax=Kitasatospora sp. NPDC008115 TaxID=3364022 RepID=UPI0036E54855